MIILGLYYEIDTGLNLGKTLPVSALFSVLDTGSNLFSLSIFCIFIGR